MTRGVWEQGSYSLRNSSKYIGKKKPEYKSNLEKRVMYYLDSNTNVLRWAYENFKVKYFFLGDGKYHDYYPDFYAEVINQYGRTKKFLIEVKSLKEIPEDYLMEMYSSEINNPEFKKILLKEPKKKTLKAKENYNRRRLTIIKNKAKFDAAREFCKDLEMEFKIITENEINKMF